MISGSAQQGLEKQPDFFATPGGQTRSSTSDPVVVSGLAPKGFEKSNTQNPGERQVMGEKRLPGFVLVPNPQSPLKQTLPMGKPASVRNDINSTASVHPSFGTAPCYAAKGLDVRQSGLQMVCSTLTPQMNSLNNSSVASQQSWIPITTDTSQTTSNQTVQTVEAMEASRQGLPIANMAQERNPWSTNPLNSSGSSDPDTPLPGKNVATEWQSTSLRLQKIYLLYANPLVISKETYTRMPYICHSFIYSFLVGFRNLVSSNNLLPHMIIL